MPVAHADEWTGRDVKVSAIERELVALRRDTMDLRTSVMTHMAWAPPEWQDAARRTLAGMAERHPSRTILLFPQPGSGRDALDAGLSLQCFTLPGLERHVCSEVIELFLHGDRAAAPASIVLPLVIPDLPVFLRWRGRPDFGEPRFEGLVDAVDRLVVDSAEWPDVPQAYGELARYFDRVAVSDIAWARTIAWRRVLAREWPQLPAALAGPPAEAALVAGWLRSRAGAEVDVEQADSLPHVVDDSPSELLSRELDRFSRDPVYEEAARAATR